MSWEEWAENVNKRIGQLNANINSLTGDIRGAQFDIRKINDTLEALMRPLVKQRIIALMLKEKKPRTFQYLRRHVEDFTYMAFNELIDDGAFTSTWSGHHHMYTLQTCDMCRLISNVKAGRPIPTKLHFSDCKMVVVDCRTCAPVGEKAFRPKMVIYLKHGVEPSEFDIKYMRTRALLLFPGRRIYPARLARKDHYHFFVR